MTRYLIILIAGLFSGLSVCPAASAPASAALQIGNWSGGAQFDPRTRHFERCAATLTNGSGTSVTFSIDRKFAWGLGFSNPSWTFGSGHSLGLILTLGNRDQIRQVARAVDANRLELLLDDSMTLFSRLRVTPQLRAAAGGLTFSFDIRDNHEIMSALAQCALQYGAPARNPKVKTPPRPDHPLKALDRSDAIRAEASALAEGIVGYAEIRGAQVLTNKVLANNKTPDDLLAHAVWKAGHVTGLVSVLQPGQAATSDGLAADLARHAGANCQGRFFLASTPDQIERLAMLRLYTSCQSEAATSSVFQTIAPRGGGGLYLLTVMIERFEYAGAIQGSAEEMDRRIRAVLPGVLAKAAQRTSSGAGETQDAEQQPR